MNWLRITGFLFVTLPLAAQSKSPAPATCEAVSKDKSYIGKTVTLLARLIEISFRNGAVVARYHCMTSQDSASGLTIVLDPLLVKFTKAAEGLETVKSFTGVVEEIGPADK